MPGATDQLKAMMEAHGAPKDPDGGEHYVGPIGLSAIDVGETTLNISKPFNVIDLPVFKFFDMVDKPGFLIGSDLLKENTVNISYGCQKIDII